MSAGSIAWRLDASSPLPRVGTPPRRRSPRIASSGRSSGDSTGFRRTAIDALGSDVRAAPADVIGDWVSHVMADTDAFFTPAPTTDYTLTPAADGDRADVSQRVRHAARGEQHGVLPVLSGGRRPPYEPRVGRPSGAARRGPRAAAMELRRRRPRRAVPAAREERHERAASQPAVSRSAHAARTAARRLHRQRQHRADGAGVPPGGARRAARDRVARGAGLRSDRHPRHQPRIVSLAADDGARTADPGAGAQSHLAVLRRRRVARALDAPRARRARRPHRARSAARAVEADQPALVSRARCAIGRRCSSTRATT